MKARRAICISRAGSSCSAVEGALAGSGVDLVVEHHERLPADLANVALVVVDRAARQVAGETLRAVDAPVIVVGDDLDDDALVALMLDAPVSHLVGDPGDRDLGITSEKLATGDLFGLEKYVAAGASVGERRVGDELGKRRAIDEVCAWAESVGARRPLLHRIASVTDELLMNALGAGDSAAVVRWAADPRTIAISVGDDNGALRQRDVIAHLRRAREERGRPMSAAGGGAGLGLYLVLANVAALVVNVTPGRQTEVVCLFDRAAPSARPAIRMLRSLHVFAGA